MQGILGTNSRQRGNTTRARVPFLLKGIVFGADGRALTPWFTRKRNGRLYRYYLPARENKEHAGASGLPRLPAAELEVAVLEQLRGVLRAPRMMVARAVELDPTLDEAQVTAAMTRLDAIWDQLFPVEQTRIVRLLVEKVIVSPNDIEVRLRANGIEELALEMLPAVPEGGRRMSMTRINKTGEPQVMPVSDGHLTISVPIQINRRGGRKLVTLPNAATGATRPWDGEATPLQLALARGLAMLESGKVRSLREIARNEGVDSSYVSRMVNLTTLVPDIVVAILDETFPPDVTLFDIAVDSPGLWKGQRGQIGMAR